MLIVEWHVAIGDAVTQNSVLATVETDKVDTDVPSPMAGTVVEILAGAGAELAVGEPLCVIES